MCKDHQYSLTSDIFIVGNFTYTSELPKGWDIHQGNCSKNRPWNQSLWLQDKVGHYQFHDLGK